MRYTASYRSPLGEMLIISTTEALVGLHFIGQKYFPRLDDNWKTDPNLGPIRATIEQLDEYFAGKRHHFEVPLAPFGTSYQHAIWKAIASVPYGETITYGEIARRAGHSRDARAAGAATGQNPIGIIVPCHRVIGANGKLAGYAGGLDKKRALLALEAEHATVSPYRASQTQAQRVLV